jgi:hypothetical protein
VDNATDGNNGGSGDDGETVPALAFYIPLAKNSRPAVTQSRNLTTWPVRGGRERRYLSALASLRSPAHLDECHAADASAKGACAPTDPRIQVVWCEAEEWLHNVGRVERRVSDAFVRLERRSSCDTDTRDTRQAEPREATESVSESPEGGPDWDLLLASGENSALASGVISPIGSDFNWSECGQEAGWYSNGVSKSPSLQSVEGGWAADDDEGVHAEVPDAPFEPARPSEMSHAVRIQSSHPTPLVVFAHGDDAA